MLLPEHRFHRPASLADCLRDLAALRPQGAADDAVKTEPVRIIAGGTDVIFNMRLRLFQPDNLISIRRLPELAQVETLDDGSLLIGAACRLADLADNPLIREYFPCFSQAIDAVASTHVRTLATLGGNLCLETRCWYTNNSAEWRRGREGCFKTDCEQCHVIPSSDSCHAINNADTPPALIALDARVVLQSIRGRRELPIAGFYRRDGLRHLALAPDELLTHVIIPPCRDRTVFMKLTPRRGMDFALGTIAVRCRVEGDRVLRAELVLGSIASAPIRLVGPGKVIEREGLSDAAIEHAAERVRAELGEVTNLYGRATYKKQLARTLVRRALHAIRDGEVVGHG